MIDILAKASMALSATILIWHFALTIKAIHNLLIES